MNMPPGRALALQSSLLVYDDIGGSCATMLKYIPDGNGSYLISAWQEAVDDIYRCIKSNLLSIDNDNFFGRYESLVDALRTTSPFKTGSDQIIWSGTFLNPTSLLLQLVGRYLSSTGFQKNVANQEFIEDLERIFVVSGVGWAPGPLVPIISEIV